MTVGTDLFSSGGAAERALRPIADVLFCELLAFGRMVDAEHLQDGLARYAERAGFIGRYLNTLESVAGLEFKNARIPYVMNTVEWGEHSDVAGHTGATNDPRPSHVALSLLSAWRSDATSNATIGALRALVPSPRLMRAALYLTEQADLGRAIAFLVDLHAHGFSSQLGIGGVLRALVNSRPKVASDADIVPGLIDGDRPRTHDDWLDIDLRPQIAGPILSPQWVPDLTECLNDARREARDYREATSWDDWVVLTFALRRRLWCTATLGECFEGRLPLGLETLVSQLEEIRADTGATISMLTNGELRARPIILDKKVFLDWLSDSLPGIDAPFDEGVTRRLLKQRVFLPHALTEASWTQVQEMISSPEWGHISWRLVHPFTALFRSEKLFTTLPLNPTPDERLLASPRIQAFSQARGIDAEHANRLAKAAETAHPPQPDDLPFELNEWKNLLAAAEIELNGELLTSEIRAAAAAAAEETHDRAVARAGSLVSRYPWSARARELLGAVLVKHGEFDRAVDELIPVIVLNPRRGDGWNLLSGALSKLGRPEEARFAFALGQIATEVLSSQETHESLEESVPRRGPESQAEREPPL